jgi:hypothetical protein
MKAYAVSHSPCTPVLASLTCLVLLALLPLPPVAAAPRMRAPAHTARPSSHISPAAPTAPTAAAVPTAPIELSKVILPENSPTGPALWTIELLDNPSSSAYNVALGWTGTDPAHHVNVRTSIDGQHFGPTLTLNETAISRPAVLAITGSLPVPRILVVAWTGTDPRHSLNVLFDVFNVTGHRSKTTLVDTSIAGPALTTNQFEQGENLQMAWTGTDPNHSLNVLELDLVSTSTGDIIGLKLGPKRTFPAQLHSLSGPELGATEFANLNTVLLTWTQTENARLGLAEVTTGGGPSSFVFFSPQTSPARPDVLAEHLVTPTTDAEHFWWSWAGTDPAHSLNLMDTADFHSWPGPVTTFAETATGGPVLGSVGPVRHQILLAWTGTDPAHLLNVAVIGV